VETQILADVITLGEVFIVAVTPDILANLVEIQMNVLQIMEIVEI